MLERSTGTLPEQNTLRAAQLGMPKPAFHHDESRVHRDSGRGSCCSAPGPTLPAVPRKMYFPLEKAGGTPLLILLEHCVACLHPLERLRMKGLGAQYQSEQTRGVGTGKP